MIQISQNISPLVQQTMRDNAENKTLQDNELLNRSAAISGNKDVSRAMRDTLTGENSLEVSAGNDTVTISEKARAMQQKSMAEKKEKANGPDGETFPGGHESVKTNLAGATGGGSAAERARETIEEQIEKVKEKIEKAKQRLAQATATGKGESAPSDEAEAAATQALGMGNATEVEAIQAEIKMLQQQLQTLQSQLMNSMESGGGRPAMGSAGIGGEGTGEAGGKGERISVG